MKFTKIVMLTALALASPSKAIWSSVEDHVDYRNCLTCVCWGPFSNGNLDNAIAGFCDNIIRAPCQNHVLTGVIGAWTYVFAGDRSKCNIQWAPTKWECTNHVFLLSVERGWNMCARMAKVYTFGRQYVGTIGTGGACIKSSSSQVCG